MGLTRSISIAVFLVALGAALVPSSLFAQNVRIMSPDQEAKFETRLRNWATSYYPAMVKEERLPDDLFFAFLVDDKDVVVRHTAAFQTSREGALLTAELARVFPGVDASLPEAAGGGCFLPKPGQPKRYCVYYAVLPK